MAPDDNFISFTVNNSSIYNGGDGSLVFKNWQLLSYTPEIEAQDNIVDIEEIEELKYFEEIIEKSTTTTDEFIVEQFLKNEISSSTSDYKELDNASTTEDFIKKEHSWVELDAVSENSTTTEDESIVEEEGNNIETEVEIIEIESEITKEAEQVKIIIEEEEERFEGYEVFEESKDLSWMDSIFLNWFKREAWAQEHISNEIKNINDLGEFRKARLKTSLAAFNNLEEQINELTEVEPESLEEISSSTDEKSVLDLVDDQEEPLIEEEHEENLASSTEEVSRNYWWQRFVYSTQAQSAHKPKLSLWYSLDQEKSSSTDIVWKQLDTITADRISNKSEDGYLSWETPFIGSWEDVNNLQIKLVGEFSGEEEFVLYLDSVWLEIEYEKEDEIEKMKKRQRWEEALELLSDKLVFGINEDGKFNLRYNKNEERVWDNIKEMIGIGNYWENVQINANLINNKNEVLNTPIVLIFNEEGEFQVDVQNDNTLKPGKYKLKFNIIDESGEEKEEFDVYQDFSWGVLAFNTNKTEYAAGETGFLQIAVLDSNGHTVCDSELEIEVSSPSGEKIYLTTRELDGGNHQYSSFIIQKNPECGPETVTSNPDYYSYFDFEEVGEYNITLTAITEGDSKIIKEVIEVVSESDISIERVGPTRIYPKTSYQMKMLIDSKTGFFGSIKEEMPGEFEIMDYQLRIMNDDRRDPFGSGYKFDEIINENRRELVWSGLELLEGDTLEITYQFDAPDISPEFYLLGPATMTSSSSVVFEEKRQWQIASDAVRNRARTVMFFAGANPGSSAENTNTNQTLTQFNFKLAEDDVDIKNAFLIIESQLEAFLNDSGTYHGYTVAFDACEETCTANAFGASQKVTKTDNTELAFDTIESMQSRILFDITDESQIASYTGGGVELEGQVGYHYMSSTTRAALAHTKAILVVTYTYDANSENITNTVTYPLEATGTSEIPGDSGTRQGVFGGACTFAAANCPQFSYNMEIPEWGGVATTSNRVSQWVNMTQINDSHGGTDQDIQVRTDSGSPSNIFHHEAQNGSTQGNFPDMYFNDLGNFAENKTQTLDFQLTGGGNNMYAIGGEIFETYIASSSKATKTRTVTFPLGVLENGLSANWGDKTANIYFPENGTATGTVSVKKAWVRLITNSIQAGRVTSVQTKVGSNATSSTWTYDSNTGGQIPKPAFTMYHVIPSDQYATLEEAMATTSVPVLVNAQNSDATLGGISAELVITYTYTSEERGYLTNLQILGLQMDTKASTTATGTTANLVFPEGGGKTIRGASLLTSYLSSDSTLTYPAGNFTHDANISASTPTCTNAHYSIADTTNMFGEFHKDVSSELSTTDDQTYNICITNNGNQFPSTGGAKMNAILSYTYQWINSPPTGSFNSANQKSDGLGTIDVSIEVNDIDQQDTRAMIEFATGTSCVFIPGGDPSLDETDINVTADWDDPALENDNTYQVGTPSSYITTASGSNSVEFDWQAKDDLGIVEGEYCLRLTVNDLLADQIELATTTVHVDTVAPTEPGALSFNSRTGTSLTLNFGATSTESIFWDYRIYYKVNDGTDPTESDSLLSSSTDANLSNIEFNGFSTTTISGLIAGTTYSVAIWAYDIYGNKASSSRVDIITNDAPTGYFDMDNTGQRNDGSGIVDITFKADDLNNQNTLKAKIEYEEGDTCTFSPAVDPTLDENPANVSASFGTLVLDDDMEYQVGSTSGWIITSPGENTVEIDWWPFVDEVLADNTYCLRLTLNDSLDDMPIPATATITVDNLVPTSTGALTSGDVDTDSIALAYDTLNPGQDTNEPSTNAYKIYYKQGTSGVSEGDTEHNNSDLDAYDFNGATSTIVSSLEQNTWYVFNIWTYDEYGNKASATEIAIKTNATLSNESLSLTNALGYGTSTNVIIAGTSTEWNIRAVVSETNGWYSIGSTTLRLADNSDESSPFSDLVFYWNQTDREFYDISLDTQNAVTLTNNSTSTCSGVTCTLDFKLQLNKNFQTRGVDYSAEVYSTNDFSTTDFDTYPDFYQIRYPYLEQTHYRWRYDDGGE